MFDDTTQHELSSNVALPLESSSPLLSSVRNLLTGSANLPWELPSMPDLAAGAAALANGTRHKITLPLSKTPAEFALVRRGEQVVIDCYGTESLPEVFLEGRQVSLYRLLETCAAASRSLGSASSNSTTADAMEALAQRIEDTPVVPDPHTALKSVRCTGGCLGNPGASIPLAFGFSASITPSVGPSNGAHAFADVHAMLFGGTLWCFSGERRLMLLEGPVMLAAQRMMSAVSALLEAWQADRELNVRLPGESFSIGLRLDPRQQVTLSITGQQGNCLSVPALSVSSAALPILRLCADLTRKLVSVDRRQMHNLRVKGLRTEVRRLRRIIRTRQRLDSFENLDPDRLRVSAPQAPAQARRNAPEPTPGRLRYTERWSAEIDSLDAGSVFLCGERILIATPKLTFALSRNNGEVAWSQPTARATSLMVGRTLLRVLPSGEVELCGVDDGQVFARSQLGARPATGLQAMFAGGGDLPPVAVLSEVRQRLVALDLRTGEPRWRFRARGEGGFNLTRAGRVLLVTRGDGSVHALDVASGEVVWRLSDHVRFCLAPAVVRDVVVVASGEPGGGAGRLYGIDLYTGKQLWHRELPAAPSAPPIAAGGHVVAAYGGSREARIAACEPRTGKLCWTRQDPGLDNGAHALPIDGALVVNTTAGRVLSLDLESGEPRWSRKLANPLTDDVPRQLEPVLRQGALFIPSAQVHILRPTDGMPLTSLLACDLVPDFLRVDERGWFYVAEESGHLRAYAAVPHLSLVR